MLKLWRTGKIVQETVQQPESTHKPLTFANLGRTELGSGLAHPVVSDAGTNGATGRLRSELEGVVAELPPKLSPFSNGRTELCALNWGRLRLLRAFPIRVCRW